MATALFLACYRLVRELKAAGAEVVYMEYEHGDAKIKSQQAQAGDTIIVLNVSRLQEGALECVGTR